MSTRGLAYALAERLQLGLGDRRLDQREDLVLLEPDMIRESPTEVVEQLKRRRARKQGCVAADQHVVEEHADDRGVVGFAVSGIGWKEKLLLDAEVQLLLGVPVVEDALASQPPRFSARCAPTPCMPWPDAYWAGCRPNPRCAKKPVTD
jgi:hypothetical protein